MAARLLAALGMTYGLATAVATAAPADPFPAPLSGCVSETDRQLRCESDLATAVARLALDLLRCDRRQANALLVGHQYDVGRCRGAARSLFDASVRGTGARVGCPSTVVRNARWLGGNLLATRAIPESVDEINGALFCDATSGIPIDAGGDEAGFVPAAFPAYRCGARVGKNFARLARDVARCAVLGAGAGLAGRPIRAAACIDAPRSGARARYDTVAHQLAATGMCPPCLAEAGQAALADALVARLRQENELLFPCDTGSLRVAFVDDTCPSAFAPAACAAGHEKTCHEAFMTGAGGDVCLTGHGDRATYIAPDDGSPDTGISHALSFTIRPGERVFNSVYPEVTGSVRTQTDGLGTLGSATGASDEAHLTLSLGYRGSRLLVLRWFTGGLPTGSSARLRVVAGTQTLIDTTEVPGPPARALRVWPTTWEGDLPVTVSAAVTSPRDLPTESADLLWHLAVLRPAGDDDADGIPNAVDPDPLDATVPGPRPASGRPRVLVLGLDAAGWDIMQPLMDAGYLPVFATIVHGGAIGAVDETVADPTYCCYCPPVWTTLATGQPLALHHMAQIASEPWDRPVPSIWRVLAGHGGTSTEVDYRNTFPAEPGTTYDVSEPATVISSIEKLYTIWPVGIPDPRDENENRLQQTWPPLLLEQLGILPSSGSRPDLWIPFAEDRVGADALLRLVQREQTDLTMWILHSVDKAEHVVWGSVQRTVDSPLDVSALLAQASRWTEPVAGPLWTFGSVASQYLEADQQLGTLLSRVSYDYIVLLSDHAMTHNPTTGPLTGMHYTPPAFHGIFVVAGPGVRSGVDLGELSAFDVAPTLAYLLDLPVADDLPGHVRTDAFTASHLAARPVRRTPSWEG